MTHHEDAHRGRRLLMVGVAVLVVSSGIETTATAPRPHVTQREIGTLTLLCITGPGHAMTPSKCRVVIHTPIR